jgi:tRNA(fMet)-specific endonuclease VapC
LPSPALAELYAWASLLERPAKILTGIAELLKDVEVLVFDDACAKTFGGLRGVLQRQGITVGPIDLMIASIALVHDHTVVTHNTADFQGIPGLRLDDWLK